MNFSHKIFVSYVYRLVITNSGAISIKWKIPPQGEEKPQVGNMPMKNSQWKEYAEIWQNGNQTMNKPDRAGMNPGQRKTSQ
ncbi:hypothetical protein DERF_005046 [Dermatophagoides farinae]|uniref:Uncharacterized protein n=1 Tax=Dermatophagoides farinae TaxID=6954 RepID=A0A922L8A6_DERFA|nr:hypothetical protein DERF_005046 [Dermatophagoides farinae]